MKKVIPFIACLFAVGTLSAQDFEKGGNYISFGYGIDPYYTPYAANRIGLGPIRVAYERGVTDILGIGRIGAGGGIAYSMYNGNYNFGNAKYKGYRFSIEARAAYHFEFDVPKMDVYAGVGAAVHVIHEPISNGFVNGYKDRVGGGHYIFGGIRYYFTDVFGVYAEVGHGVSALNGGIVLAF